MRKLHKTVLGVVLASAIGLSACAEHKDRDAASANPSAASGAATDRETGPREHAGY